MTARASIILTEGVYSRPIRSQGLGIRLTGDTIGVTLGRFSTRRPCDIMILYASFSGSFVIFGMKFQKAKEHA